MKPINEKERTTAFLQFIILFFVVIVLTVVLVYFDYGVKEKQYQSLKTENQQLKSEAEYLTHISFQIDSIVGLLKTLDKASATDFDNTYSSLRIDLKNWSSGISEDSTTLERIKISLSKAFMDWSNDKRAVNAQINDKSNCDEVNKQKQALQEKFDELKDEYNNYKLTH